ncbi:hypothetical protein FSP39_014273 [Pinctada imbricata]|uniref:C2H2-type domain-containing protein n=1 Tax=Pinctada imbricata TaxID=66713 RepID=A0AA88YCP2_PINIB|nr:hypothetical protein FSP39_014273 [Pinctada imbricata]
MCEHCDYCTPKRAMLGRHLRIHGIFVCLRCNYICDTRSKLKEHVLEVHRDRADYKLCRNCSRYVKCADITIEQHMEICQGPVPFKCPHCDKEFKYESSLKSHVIRHNPDAPKKFHCPECPYESNYKANLKKHLKNIHSDKTETEYKCPFADCEKIFHTQDNLKRHFKFHSDERPHACTKCDKKFKTAAALRGHYVVHSPSRPFKCNINDCTKDFRSKKLLKNHMEEFHNLTEKKYACDYAGCDFAFFKRSHLERHKITHTGERKFGCTACGKAFRHSDNLKVHMRQHTNEKPVKCHLCSFACRQKSSLQYHLRKFHQIFNRPRSISSEAKNLSTLVSAVYSSVDDGLTSSVSSESKENHQGLPLDSKEEIEEQKNTEPFSPIKKSQNAMDLYEFRSDEEFGDDSILMPLRQERTSTPLRPEKISSHQSVSFDENSESSDKTDTKLDDQQSSTLSEKNSGEIVESIKIEDIIIEEVVKFAENNEGESSFVKNDQVKEPEEPVKVLPKPKKKPGRKKGFKLKPKTEETAKPIKDKDEAKNPESEEVTEKAEPPAKPKGKRGRKPKAQKLLEQAEKVEAKNTSEEKPQEKPPRKKPGPKPKKDKDKKEVDKAVKIPKKRGPKKKKVVPVDDNTEDQEEPSPPRKKRKYTRRKSTGKKPGRKPKGEKADKEDSVEEEEETIIYSELDQNTAKEDEDDGEATEIEGFDDDDRKSPSIEEKAEEKVEESEEIVEVPEKIQEENDNKDPQSPVIEEEEEEEKDKADTAIVPEVTENEAVAKVEVEEKKGEEESERMSSGIDTDFEEDLKPPPAPRPPPVVDSDEGDIESGPEEMDTPGRDFESTPPKSVQNHSVQSLRDYESTPPKSVQPDSVPNYGSIENKNDVLSPELQQPPSQPPLSQGYTEDRSELSNPVPSNISYAPPGSVELPGSAQSVPQATSQNGQEYVSQSDSTMPEVDKDYLGQYLQQFDSNRSEDENNRLSQAEERPEDHLNIPTSPQKELSSLNMSSPGVPPLNLSTSSDRGEGIPPKGTDMSNKRMEILSVDRQHEEHFQTRSENPSRSSERIPDNVYDSISSMNSYLPPGSRETPTIFPPTSTSTPYMPFSENEAILQRQRMTTPFLAQNDQNALQNLHRMTDSALASNNPSSLLRRPTTVPSREEIFSNPSAVAQSMARNPFHSTWSSQDVRHPHWSQTPYLQRPIDRQSGTTTNSLFAKDNYLTGRDFVFDTSRRSVTERNMFPGLAQSQRPELPHETFPSNERFDFSYFGLPGYPGAPTLDYARSAGTTSQKTFDERYRQTTGSMADFRGLPQSTTSEMFRSMNSTFNFDKYMYARDPMYHTQHISESTNSPFLPHGVPTQHAMFDRDYTRGFYQNGPYGFMNDKPYAAAAAAASAKLSHTTTPGMGQDREFVPRPNTAAAAAADSQMQDPYRHPMLYNMMNRYFE